MTKLILPGIVGNIFATETPPVVQQIVHTYSAQPHPAVAAAAVPPPPVRRSSTVQQTRPAAQPEIPSSGWKAFAKSSRK